MGRRGAGAVADRVSTRPVAPALEPGCKLPMFLAHGVGVNQAAKSDVDFSYASIHEFSIEERAHVGYAKRVDSLRACFSRHRRTFNLAV